MFITEDFLLETRTAHELYHGFAANQPIIDYHCHLSPEDIATDRVFGNISRIWLEGDHYKWRAMRTLGVEEKFITGDASDHKKFGKWAECVPATLRNPLYHWTHLELKRYFNIDELLNSGNADDIYKETGKLLSSSDYSTRNLLRKMKVEVVCTTDDPVDDLKWHRQIASDDFEIKVLPAFRPDKVLLISGSQFADYINALAQASGKDVYSLDGLLEALLSRIEFFHAEGCRLSDHGLDHLVSVPYDLEVVKETFNNRLAGKAVSKESTDQYQTFVLEFLSREYHRLGWAQQFHLGALRNNNSRLLKELGPDTGFDSIGDSQQASSLSAHLNRLEEADMLAKTIVYNLNPSYNEVFATMIGNFYQEGVQGKMQFGSGWWFNDQKQGMERQLDTLSNMGLLSCFIGMLTDSRSFMSFPRHEYFRRILCNMLGNDVQKGLIPEDLELLGGMVSDICYFNAKNYFSFDI